MDESLKYRQLKPPEGAQADLTAQDEYIDEATAKEISHVLKQSELQTRLDMHQQKLGRILQFSRNPGTAGELQETKTLKD